MADIDRIAREGAELAGKATKGPMTCVQDHDCTRDGRRGGAPMQEVCVGEMRVARCTIYSKPADGELFAHAGTHYAALCRAVIERGEEVERLRVDVATLKGALEHLSRILAFCDVSDATREIARAALRGKEGA